MSDISKTTVDKIKIIGELANDPAVKQLSIVLAKYIDSTNNDVKELGFSGKVDNERDT